MNFENFRALSAHDRALVMIAILLDGHEGEMYLESDSENGRELARVAREIASLQPDFRALMAGHQLRTALEELQERRREGGVLPRKD